MKEHIGTSNSAKKLKIRLTTTQLHFLSFHGHDAFTLAISRRHKHIHTNSWCHCYRNTIRL